VSRIDHFLVRLLPNERDEHLSIRRHRKIFPGDRIRPLREDFTYVLCCIPTRIRVNVDLGLANMI